VVSTPVLPLLVIQLTRSVKIAACTFSGIIDIVLPIKALLGYYRCTKLKIS